MQVADPYHIIPYPSIPIPESHPCHLAVLGRMFGLACASPPESRILDLGCASGGNLIPLAWRLPNARCVGVDLAENQIAEGQALADRLGLNNIELKAGNLLDIDESIGQFDYILAHGIYSWVPAPVRTGILSLARRLLAPAGILYVSYNTLPGWRMRGMLRDILLHACGDEQDPRNRMELAQEALARLEPALAGLDALSALYLREEMARLRRAPPSYLLFEYLAQENTPFLLTDFVNTAQENGLSYLCDSELAIQFPSGYGEGTEQALADIGDDLELEQWLDFVANRNFRRSLLCRDDAEPDPAIALEPLAECALHANTRPPAKLELRRNKLVPFHLPDGARVEASHPLTKSILAQLHRAYPSALPFAELMDEAQREVDREGGSVFAPQVGNCMLELFTLFAQGSLKAQLHEDRIPSPGDTPKPSALALAQLEAGYDEITTLHHTTLDLDELAVKILQLLDGSRTADQVAALIAQEIRAGNLVPPAELARPVPGGVRIEPQLEKLCGDMIKQFGRLGVLDNVNPKPAR